MLKSARTSDDHLGGQGSFVHLISRKGQGSYHVIELQSSEGCRRGELYV